MLQPLSRADHLTFRANVRLGRHGWLRLTPAYSVHVVHELLDAHAGPGAVVLDPFCGTGTTALVCAERGIACETTDINPFLVWLARAKTRRYAAADVAAFREVARGVAGAMTRARAPQWAPPIHRIERWWSAAPLAALARARAFVRDAGAPKRARDLLDLAFCRACIESADVSFAHQSMSFRAARAPRTERDVVAAWDAAVDAIARGAESRVDRAPAVHLADARALDAALDASRFTCVVTSPPYPNRMSYVRELRPYMYWLGYLEDAREAGELDWRAMGGTWGCATSNVAKWSAPEGAVVPHAGFDDITRAIGGTSDVLARYVAKYFHDARDHVASLARVLAPGATVHYVVGNSKFYDVMLPVEAIYASLFAACGFADATYRAIRKRTSKKELYEFVVSARFTGDRGGRPGSRGSPGGSPARST
jgi:SAM-dependent methyltransferase